MQAIFDIIGGWWESAERMDNIRPNEPNGAK